MTPPRFSLAVALVTLLAGATGCIEPAVYEKTAGQLDAATRASLQKDQQIRALEWQVATLAQQLREAQLRGEAAQRDLSAQLQQAAAANATLAERVKNEEEARQRLAQLCSPDDSRAAITGRGRPDEIRRLTAALDAQNARILERLGRLEQKIDAARATDDRNGQRPRPARPDRGGDADIVDPWGYGARK